MSIDDKLKTAGDAGIDPDDLADYEDWHSLYNVYDESLWDTTNICALAKKLDRKHGDNATAILNSNGIIYLLLNPGIDWDSDALDADLNLIENGHHFDEAGFAKAEMEYAEEFWDCMTRSEKIEVTQQAGVSPRHAFLAGKPPNEVYEHLIEYMSQ